MKVLDVGELQDSIKQITATLTTKKESIHKLENAVSRMTELDDSFRGQGGEAIRAFYQQHHMPLLALLSRTVEQYASILKGTAQSIRSLEPSDAGFIRETFLEEDIPAGLRKVRQVASQLTDEANRVADQVSHIVHLSRMDDQSLQDGINRARQTSDETKEKLHAFDQNETKALRPIEENMALMERYLTLLQTIFIQKRGMAYSLSQLKELVDFAFVKNQIMVRSGYQMVAPQEQLASAMTVQTSVVPMRKWEELYGIGADHALFMQRANACSREELAAIETKAVKGQPWYKKTANSVAEIFTDMWDGLSELNQKKTDSLYDFLNYMLIGIPGGVKNVMDMNQENWDKLMKDPSFFNTLNYATMGMRTMVTGAFNPADPLSKEHLLNSLGVATTFAGGGAVSKGLKGAAKPDAPKVGGMSEKAPAQPTGPRIKSSLNEFMPHLSPHYSAVVPGVGRIDIPAKDNFQQAKKMEEQNINQEIRHADLEAHHNFIDLMNKEDAARYSQFNEYAKNNIDVIDRVKLSRWDFKPSGELYNSFKQVYDNPKYYNQFDGSINWPSNNGFAGNPREKFLQKGFQIDRYGEPGGSFFSPQGIPFEQRALAPHSTLSNYYKYEVKKPFKVLEGEIAPWFDQPGGGKQFYAIDVNGNMLTLQDLIDGRYIKKSRDVE
ncbi:MAG: T7SS effector LXG polymorphic toxin [Bacillus sp. (in: firmicutes)]